MFSSGYGLYTECAQSRGPENVGFKRTCPPAMARTSVQSPSRITLENNGKIRPQPDRENAFAGASGGGDGSGGEPSLTSAGYLAFRHWRLLPSPARDQDVTWRRNYQISNETPQYVRREPAAGMGAHCDKVGSSGRHPGHCLGSPAADNLDFARDDRRVECSSPGITLPCRLSAQFAGHFTARTVTRQALERDRDRMEGSQCRVWRNGPGHPQGRRATGRETHRDKGARIVMIDRIIDQKDRPQRSAHDPHHRGVAKQINERP